MPTPQDERARRLADALRANLRKRKQGQRQLGEPGRHRPPDDPAG
jgi:hypothetical protein